MLIGNVNQVLANKLFKFWPIIIIVIGLEVLYYHSRKIENQKVGFNPLIIFVIIIFIMANGYVDIKNKYKEKWGLSNGFSVGDFINKFENGNFNFDFNFNGYNEIEVNKNIEFNGKSFKILANNSSIEVVKSEDRNIKIEGTLFIDKDWGKMNYDIQPQIINDTCTIDCTDNKIKKIKVKIYIPEGCNFDFDGNNMKITSDDLNKSVFNISGNNGDLNIDSALSLNANMNNGSLKTNDVENIKLRSNNITAKIEGKTEVLDAKINNGMFNLNNEICKDIYIELNSGTVKVNTSDKNIGVNINLDSGTSQVNDEKRTNSGISKSFGTAAGKINIKMDSGTATVRN